RKRITTPQQDRFLMMQSLRNRTLTAPALERLFEARFCLYSSDRRVRVHRRPGERYS
ncbi:unnamed protein product, partial [Tenebrio molitor]